MKQFAVIGLGAFGRRVLEELKELGADVLLIDKDRDAVEAHKDIVKLAYVADALDEQVIRRLVPETIDAAIIDLGDQLEASILVVNYLKKMGVGNIIAQAESDQHGEILQIVGAHRVIFPDREAARRVVPMLASAAITSFLPLGGGFVIAEVSPPERYFGKTLIEANLRAEHGVNVIAVRRGDGEEYSFFTPAYRIVEGDVFLVGGMEEDISKFGGITPPSRRRTPGVVNRFLSWLKQ
jgi:trk system potassium uptake protein TrkA